MTNIPKKTFWFRSSNNSMIYIAVYNLDIMINASLCRSNIPVELRDIISKYYGKEISSEHVLYPRVIEAMRNDQQLAISRRSTLPYVNLSDFKFTNEIQYYFGVSMFEPKSFGYRQVQINPQLYYELYLKEYPDTVIPRITPETFPNLPVPYGLHVWF